MSEIRFKITLYPFDRRIKISVLKIRKFLPDQIHQVV